MRTGTPLPLGATPIADGVNFALFSRHATTIWLELYDAATADKPSALYELTTEQHRTGDIWHIWLAGVQPGQLYGYRAEGLWQPDKGMRFNAHKLLLDPYAKAISMPAGGLLWRDCKQVADDLTLDTLDDAMRRAKAMVVAPLGTLEPAPFPRHSWSNTIIYETHVRGMSIHPSATSTHPGTYRGLIEKLPYLCDLGITAIELMPIFEFNEQGVALVDPTNNAPLRNYWGYDPLAWFSPKAGYADDADPRAEFRALVEACHQAGIEVILDVVFNHSAEGNEEGPTLHFRGLDNTIYYLLDDNPRFYRNYTGTGNTLKADHPVVRDFILDALRYWVSEFRVDGFRFDLASVLARGEQGELLPDTPLLERIAQDPILREAKLIAEAWDAAGAYQVGHFAETRWSEWNGRYRDDVRRFWRGDEGMLGLFASRLCGSSDLYRASGKGPESSINFITCHDGFTLNDLVSYTQKHNEANGENNRDGQSENFSANYGGEGSTDDPVIDALHRRQIKNFLLTLLVSRGVPMLLGGDEFRRTQQGNNNAWCQDNETSWFDWSLLAQNQDIHQFVRDLIALRRAHPMLSREQWYEAQEIEFFAPAGLSPAWDNPQARQLSVLIKEGKTNLCLLFNASQDTVEFKLPESPPGKDWQRVVDTFEVGLRGGRAEPGKKRQAANLHYTCGPNSSAILIST